MIFYKCYVIFINDFAIFISYNKKDIFEKNSNYF